MWGRLAGFAVALTLVGCGDRAATPSTSPAITGVRCDPSPAHQGDLLSVLVRIDEPLSAPPAVEVGDWLADCGPAVDGEYTCAYPVHGAEGEGDVRVRVTAFGLAGDQVTRTTSCVFTGPPPRIVALQPSPGQVVSTAPLLEVVFDKPMQADALAAALSLTDAPGTLDYDPTIYTARFVPSQDLHYDGMYTLAVSAAAVDTWGQPIINPQAVTFRIGPQVAYALPPGDLAAPLASPDVAVAENGNALLLVEVDGGYQAILYDATLGAWSSQPHGLWQPEQRAGYFELMGGATSLAVVYNSAPSSDPMLIADIWREGEWHRNVITRVRPAAATGTGRAWMAAMRDDTVAVAFVETSRTGSVTSLAVSTGGSSWQQGSTATPLHGPVELVELSLAPQLDGTLTVTAVSMDWSWDGVSAGQPISALTLSTSTPPGFPAYSASHRGLPLCQQYSAVGGQCTSTGLASLPSGEFVLSLTGLAGEVFATAFASSGWSALSELAADPPGWFDLTPVAPGASGQAVLLRHPAGISGSNGAAVLFVSDGALWSAPQLGRGYNYASFAREDALVTDGEGFRTLWTEAAGLSPFTVWSSAWTGTDWSAPEVVGSSSTGVADLRATSGLYVATWGDGSSFRASVHAGADWGPAVEIPSSEPPIVLDAPGRVSLVWKQGDALWERSATAAGFDEAVMLAATRSPPLAAPSPAFATSDSPWGAAAAMLTLGSDQHPTATVARLGADGWGATENAFVSPPAVPTEPRLLSTGQSGDVLVRWQQSDGYDPVSLYAVLSRGAWSQSTLEPALSYYHPSTFVASETSFLHVRSVTAGPFVPDVDAAYAEVWTADGWAHRLLLANTLTDTYAVSVGSEFVLLWQTPGITELHSAIFDGQSWSVPEAIADATLPLGTSSVATADRVAFWTGPIRNTFRIYEDGDWREVAAPLGFDPYGTAESKHLSTALTPFAGGAALAWADQQPIGVPAHLWLAVLDGDTWQAHDFGPIATGSPYRPVIRTSGDMVSASWPAVSSGMPPRGRTMITYAGGRWIGPEFGGSAPQVGPGGHLVRAYLDADCRPWFGGRAPDATEWTDLPLDVPPGVFGCYGSSTPSEPVLAVTPSRVLVALAESDPVSNDLWVRTFEWQDGVLGSPRDLFMRPAGLYEVQRQALGLQVNGEAVLLTSGRWDSGQSHLEPGIRAALLADGTWAEDLSRDVAVPVNTFGQSAYRAGGVIESVQNSTSHFAVATQPPRDAEGTPQAGQVHVVH